jgi:hypothetical protein
MHRRFILTNTAADASLIEVRSGLWLLRINTVKHKLNGYLADLNAGLIPKLSNFIPQGVFG